MSPTRMFLVAAALFAATPALAQPVPAQSETLELTGTLTVDDELYEAPTTVGSEQLEFASSYSDASNGVLGWREDNQQTANRARARGSRGASSVRVIRACEVSLQLGDEDCAGN